MDRSLRGGRHHTGIAALVRIPFPYTEWKAHSEPFGEVHPEGSVSLTGRLLLAPFLRAGARDLWRLRRPGR